MLRDTKNGASSACSVVAPQVRLELTTPRLTAECSAIELLRNIESGNVLSSRAVTSQVLSALKSLTSVFGMGTGGTSSPISPEMEYNASSDPARLWYYKPKIPRRQAPYAIFFMTSSGGQGPSSRSRIASRGSKASGVSHRAPSIHHFSAWKLSFSPGSMCSSENLVLQSGATQSIPHG